MWDALKEGQFSVDPPHKAFDCKSTSDRSAILNLPLPNCVRLTKINYICEKNNEKNQIATLNQKKKLQYS